MKKRSAFSVSVLTAAMILITGCAGGSGGGTASDTGVNTNIFNNPGVQASQTAPGGENSSVQPASTPEQNVPTPTQPANVQANVRLGEWANIEWEQFSCPYFTLTVPKGWQVNYDGDLNFISFNVTNPSQQLVGMTYRDRGNVNKSFEGAQLQGASFYFDQGTVQDYYEKFFQNSTEYFTVKNTTVPNDLQGIQAARPNDAISDYRTLYAQFKQNGLEGEGLYSALIFYGDDVYMNGANYGMWEVDFASLQWAPIGELANWLPVYTQIRQSFAYTQDYIAAVQQSIASSSSISSNLSNNDVIVEAFEERSLQDTIIQEKRSDMIGEYERVYDNDTGNIYRAYNGFLDDIGTDQKKYTPITDNQYADGFVGWIDKPY